MLETIDSACLFNSNFLSVSENYITFTSLAALSVLLESLGRYKGDQRGRSQVSWKNTKI